jgi:hypothetical protein
LGVADETHTKNVFYLKNTAAENITLIQVDHDDDDHQIFTKTIDATKLLTQRKKEKEEADSREGMGVESRNSFQSYTERLIQLCLWVSSDSFWLGCGRETVPSLVILTMQSLQLVCFGLA